MQEIEASIGQVSKVVMEISVASREQFSGIEQIGQAVVHMDLTTQQHAMLLEDASASAESLRVQSKELAEVARKFKYDAGDVPQRRGAMQLEVRTLETAVRSRHGRPERTGYGVL